MWLWQLKNVPREIKVWLKLIGISFIVHMILIGIFVKGYRNQVVEAVLTINTSRPVFFVALSAKQPVSPMPVKNSTANVASSLQKTAQKPIIKKEPIKQEAQKTGLVTAKKEPVKNVPAKKTEPQKSAASKSMVAQKQEVKQQVEKKELKETPKPITPQKVPVQEQIVQALPIASSAIAPQEYHNSAVVSEQTMPIEYYNLVQTIMVQWRAPYGMQGTPSCRIKALINKLGEIEDIEIEESSGILMFDIAARSALLNTQMPEWTRGKSFVITFKQ